MKTTISVDFKRGTTNSEEKQHIYDYITSLGWKEFITFRLPTGGTDFNTPVRSYVFLWLSNNEPVFPENVEYSIGTYKNI